MQQIFVEMYNYKTDWMDLSVPEREAFIGTLASALKELQGSGVEVLAYAVNDPATDHRAPYDFFCVYRVPEVGLQRMFEIQIAASGWYKYFEQANLSGAARTPAGILMKNVYLKHALPQGKTISPAKRSAKKSAVVDGHVMTYAERGEGTPVVFIHGDVMSSFLWENVTPYVAKNHRAIAVDLIGAGDSAKLPTSGEGTYSFETHAHYLDGLLDKLDLGDDIILVGHDWGSNLAFDWAMKNGDRVHAIAFTEAVLPPFDWSDWPVLVHPVFEHLRTPKGGQDVLDNNFFLNSLRDNVARVLAPDEWAEILRPYANPGEGRRPTLDWPRSVPFGDDDTPIRKMLEDQAEWLTRTSIAKLHMAGMPGGIEFIGGRRRDAIAAFPNLSVIQVEGLHWTPLDDPHTMGEGLATWLASVTQS